MKLYIVISGRILVNKMDMQKKMKTLRKDLTPVLIQKKMNSSRNNKKRKQQDAKKKRGK